MVFLAITRKGLEEALELAKPGNEAVWRTSAAIKEYEFNAMNEANLTRFNYSFTTNETELISDAIETIKEHHPGENVWIEGSNEL